MRALRIMAVLAATFCGATACGLSEAPPKIYVLGDGAAVKSTNESQLNALIVEVREARVPDYLDTTDIVTRGTGGLITPSPSGRWGERFSIGVTRAVTAVLRKDLPQLAVTNSARWADPHWQVGIVVDAFDVRQNGGSTLDATWAIIGRQQEKLAEQRVVLTDSGTFQSDAEVVAVTQRQMDQLAQRITASLASIAGVPDRSISTVANSK